MKILLLNDDLEARGGAERSFQMTVELLTAHGHECAVLGGKGGEDARSLWSRWLSASYYRRTAQMLAAFRPDVIHCHNISRVVSPSPLLAARRRGIPVVMTIRDPHLFCVKSWAITNEGELCPHFALACLRRCRGDRSGAAAVPYYLVKYFKIALHRAIIARATAHFICPSHALHTLLLANFPDTDGRSTVLPNFPDERALEPPPADFSATRFLFIGRIVQSKGLHLALQALARLVPDCPDITLDVVGEGPELRMMQSYARTLGITERVTFYGRLPHARVDEQYRRCLAVLVPSLWVENNPRVVLEAMQHGRPVIASDRGGFTELIEHGRTGLLVQADEVAALAHSMRRLYGRGPEALQMGRAARAKLDREFSREAHYRTLRSIYQEVAAAPLQDQAPGA